MRDSVLQHGYDMLFFIYFKNEAHAVSIVRAEYFSPAETFAHHYML